MSASDDNFWMCLICTFVVCAAIAVTAGVTAENKKNPNSPTPSGFTSHINVSKNKIR